MKMDIKPIEIDIDDNRAYTQLALFVDTPGFLDEIINLRKKLGIKSPFNFTKASDSELRLLNKPEFDEAISTIRRKYNYPEMFDSAVRDAVFYHKISHFRTAYAKSYVYPTYSIRRKNQALYQDQYMAIIVTPQSTEDDIKKAFDECKSDIFISQTWKSPVYQSIDIDTISNIKRDRDWYWRNLSGEQPHNIAVSDNKGLEYYSDVKKRMKFAGDLTEKQRLVNERYLQFVQDYTETVRKAINRYKEKLLRHLAGSQLS